MKNTDFSSSVHLMLASARHVVDIKRLAWCPLCRPIDEIWGVILATLQAVHLHDHIDRFTIFSELWSCFWSEVCLFTYFSAPSWIGLVHLCVPFDKLHIVVPSNTLFLRDSDTLDINWFICSSQISVCYLYESNFIDYHMGRRNTILIMNDFWFICGKKASQTMVMRR